MSIALCLCAGCKPGQRDEIEALRMENDSLKQLLQPDTTGATVTEQPDGDLDLYRDQLTADIAALKAAFGNDKEYIEIDRDGDLKLNTGAASTGRVYLNLREVRLRKEERPEEPGCADVCPPRAIISFECRKGDCIADPAMLDMGKFNTGAIELTIEKGRVVFPLLQSIQSVLLNE
jgi:hypothetical protein